MPGGGTGPADDDWDAETPARETNHFERETSPLTVAARDDNTAGVERLLAEGVPLSQPDPDGCTVLERFVESPRDSRYVVNEGPPRDVLHRVLLEWKLRLRDGREPSRERFQRALDNALVVSAYFEKKSIAETLFQAGARARTPLTGCRIEPLAHEDAWDAAIRADGDENEMLVLLAHHDPAGYTADHLQREIELAEKLAKYKRTNWLATARKRLVGVLEPRRAPFAIAASQQSPGPLPEVVDRDASFRYRLSTANWKLEPDTTPPTSRLGASYGYRVVAHALPAGVALAPFIATELRAFRENRTLTEHGRHDSRVAGVPAIDVDFDVKDHDARAHYLVRFAERKGWGYALWCIDRTVWNTPLAKDAEASIRPVCDAQFATFEFID